MSGIMDQYRELNSMRDPIIEGKADFLGLVEFMRRHDVCFQPGCTTCGCRGYRMFLKELGEENIAKMMNLVKRDKVLEEYDLDWHDALEVLLVNHSPVLFKDSYIYKAYNFVWNEYRRFRHTEHLKPWAARAAVRNELQSFAE